MLRVSLPSDFSIAKITGLASQTTIEEVVVLLSDRGFEVQASDIKIFYGKTPKETTATVKIEDRSFAERLSIRLKEEGSTLSAIAMPVSSR